MKVLVVYAHPEPESTVGRMYNAVHEELNHLGHDVRLHDLYEERFVPVMSDYERKNHSTALEPKLKLFPELAPYVENLKWCEALVLVYPTWWSGQPAIMKGWVDRVFVNEVAWTLPDGENRIRPLLTNIRRLVVVTTHGSTKFVNALEGESGKRTAFRSLRLMMHWRTRCKWIAFYKFDRLDEPQKAKAVTQVRRQIRRAL
jgi:putative NADPH-quinone reductase